MVTGTKMPDTLYVGSLLLINEPARSATLEALRLARAAVMDLLA